MRHVLCLVVLAGMLAACGGSDNILEPTCDGVTCSGHGTCAVTGGAALCTCEAGFAGSDCSACAEGYHRDENGGCALPGPCALEPEQCGDHGVCLERAGEAVCLCETGWAGAACDGCAAGYEPDDVGGCVWILPGCAADSCSGHGSCDDSGGTIACACDTGYAGADCSACAAGYVRDETDACVLPGPCADNPDLCGAHGVCLDPDGVAVCLCETAWVGATCDACAPGYAPDGAGGCVWTQPSCAIDSCSGHGICDSSGGVISCTCDTGYAGTICSACAEGYFRDESEECVLPGPCAADPDLCGAHGVCLERDGAAVCLCETGWAGASCDECAPGYEPDGAGGCRLVGESCTTESCAGHGWCDDSGGAVTCTCLEGYVGARCNLCDTGWHLLAEGDCAPDESCAVTDPCGAHGTCQDAGGSISCTCDTGWAGALCDACALGYHPDAIAGCALDEVCPDPDPCLPHGTCDDTGGILVCLCETGYAGATCDECAPGYVDHGGVCELPDSCHELTFGPVAYLHTLVISSEGAGCCHDLDSDGTVDNAFGNFVAQMASMGADANAMIEQEIQDGNLCRLFEFMDLDALQTDPDLGLVWTGCTDPDGSFGDNLSGTESFTIGEEWFVPLPAGGCSTERLAPFDGSAVANFALDADAASLPGFPLPLPLGEGLPMATIPLVGVVLDATLADVGHGPQAVSGTMSGIILMVDWYGAFNAFVTGSCACLNLTEDLFEVSFDPGYNVTCHTSGSSVCGSTGVESTCQMLNDYCGMMTMLLSPDQDSDGDGVLDGMSVGMQLETISAVATGITP